MTIYLFASNKQGANIEFFSQMLRTDFLCMFVAIMKNEDNCYFVAKTYAGLEPLLARELASLGARNCRTLSRSVSFEGDLELMYRANYYSRLALRILWRQKTFTFGNNRQFYEQLFDFPAERFLRDDGTMAVNTTNVDSIFSTPLFASVLAKDAVCDRFRDMCGRRPSVDKDNPDVRFCLHIYKNEAQLFLDSSGDSLHRRGYRVRNHPAPVSEVTAAAMIELSGWNGECDFIDPMCGSGTLLVEAAMKALQIPAGFYRREYGFSRWKDFDSRLWTKVRNAADIKEDVPVNFYGSDINAAFLNMAQANIDRARLSDFISLKKMDFRQVRPVRLPAVAMMNPPYGERLELDDINAFYADMGDTFKSNLQGCRAFVISSDLDALKHIGLKPCMKAPMFNGPLECRFVGYELFSGSHKDFVRHKHENEQ